MITATPESPLNHLDSEWDCVVVGAGPAGAMAARRAARWGLKTLIVEKKPFPRPKVCGACVNRRAISVLKSVGLDHIPHELGGKSITQFQVRSAGREVTLPLPGGIAISRSSLDAALVESAIAEGAAFLAATSARVLPTPPGNHFREVSLSPQRTLSGADATRNIRARVVIAADGLGHPCLQQLSEFTDTVAKNSRIGIGAVAPPTSDGISTGTIGMAVGKHGYAGMVRVEDGRLNIAAAVDADFLQKAGDPGAAVRQILRHAGYSDANVDGATWMGTRPLTRRINKVSSERLLVVGDAAAYVEPFTGEGITWALAGGLTAADCAAGAIRHSVAAAERLWQVEWTQQIQRRQKWCRRLAWMLRHPTAVHAAVRTAAWFPALTRPIVKQLNSPFVSLKVSTS